VPLLAERVVIAEVAKKHCLPETVEGQATRKQWRGFKPVNIFGGKQIPEVVRQLVFCVW